MIPDNLKAVLLLNGPGELKTFVLDVSQKEHYFIDGLFGKITYEIQESSLGPEGWVGVEKKRESQASQEESGPTPCLPPTYQKESEGGEG